MAQAGLHALMGQAVARWLPKKEYLMTGLLFGSIFPDFDGLAVAAATLAKQSTDGLHRTATHSLLFALLAFGLFWLFARLRRQVRWSNFGAGFAVGIVLHSLLDLLLWFNGVAILWPLPVWINFWENANPPIWLDRLINPFEFAFMAGFIGWLAGRAHGRSSDVSMHAILQAFFLLLLSLTVIFTPLAFWMEKGFMTLFGAVYLVMLGLAAWVIFRMRATIEGV